MRCTKKYIQNYSRKVEGKRQREKPVYGWKDDINGILGKSGIRVWT
jgi:hypothetical protein